MNEWMNEWIYMTPMAKLISCQHLPCAHAIIMPSYSPSQYFLTWVNLTGLHINQWIFTYSFSYCSWVVVHGLAGWLAGSTWNPTLNPGQSWPLTKVVTCSCEHRYGSYYIKCRRWWMVLNHVLCTNKLPFLVGVWIKCLGFRVLGFSVPELFFSF
jgi:hypothetical protein